MTSYWHLFTDKYSISKWFCLLFWEYRNRYNYSEWFIKSTLWSQGSRNVKKGTIGKCSFPLSNYVEIENKIEKFFRYFIHFDILKVSKLCLLFKIIESRRKRSI